MRSAVRAEFAKMHRLRLTPLLVLMVVAVVGLAASAPASDPGFDPATPDAWNVLLLGLSGGIPLVTPLLIAVLASRLVDMEHQSNGWLFSAGSGLGAGVLCRSKLVALGALVALATLLECALAVGVGKLYGVPGMPPAGPWVGYVLCALAVNGVVLACHILLATTVENQLVGLGIGLLGTLVAVFAIGWPAVAAHLTPWGYYALAAPVDYQGPNLVEVPVAYPSIAALVVVGVVCFAVVTARLDRQEA